MSTVWEAVFFYVLSTLHSNNLISMKRRKKLHVALSYKRFFLMFYDHLKKNVYPKDNPHASQNIPRTEFFGCRKGLGVSILWKFVIQNQYKCIHYLIFFRHIKYKIWRRKKLTHYFATFLGWLQIRTAFLVVFAIIFSFPARWTPAIGGRRLEDREGEGGGGEASIAKAGR